MLEDVTPDGPWAVGDVVEITLRCVVHEVARDGDPVSSFQEPGYSDMQRIASCGRWFDAPGTVVRARRVRAGGDDA